MRFLVAIPTFQRAQFLGAAIESVIGQTHGDWRLLVIDDGSTDGTRAVVERYAKEDNRIMFSRSEENLGGVAANAVGMTLAVENGFDAWVRLGSDDWFLPRKLELDALALEHAGACFGPYETEPTGYDCLNVPMDARAALLRGEFAASWANVAYRTEVLRKVFERHGDFVDARIRNMEDNLFNIRAARFTEFVWRAELAGGRIAIGARSVDAPPAYWGDGDATADKTLWPLAWKPDARYRIGADPVCCSNSPEGRAWGAKDANMTLVVRGEDAAKGFPVDEITQTEMRVL